MSATTTTQAPAPQPRTSRSSTNVREKTIKSKDSSKCTSPTRAEEKKLPPIKAPVGLAKGPDLKNVKSKIGSFQNLKHQPAKGEKKQLTQKLEWRAASKIGSLDYAHHRPGGGEKKLVTQKLEWRATSRIGSLENVKHRPGGGQIKIFNERYSGRSCSEVRKPSTRQPSTVRSSSPTSAKLNSKSNGPIENGSTNSVKTNANNEQKQVNEHSSRAPTSKIDSEVNGIQQKQPDNSKLMNDLEKLSIEPVQINNMPIATTTDLLS